MSGFARRIICKEMNLHDYIEKLRAKPIRERKRIAVIATAISFSIILLIWVITFKEMNKAKETEAEPAAASLNDLKKDFQTGKDSIQDMMQQLPSETSPAAPTDNSGVQPGNDSLKSNDSMANPESILAPTENNSNDQNDQGMQNIPQLP